MALRLQYPVERIVLAVPDIKALESKLIAAGYHLNAPIAQQAKYQCVGQVGDPDGDHGTGERILSERFAGFNDGNRLLSKRNFPCR